MPSSLFASLAQQCGSPLQGGATVYVVQDGDTVTITPTPAQGAVPHVLATARRRLLFAARGRAPFVPGTRYTVAVSSAGLTIDLS